MKPAWSVILLTTLIGAGQGLFLALATVQVYAWAGLLPALPGRALYVSGSVLSLALLAAGLLASFFHLGRPERAWRAAAQWRSSWLSREVIVLPALMAAVAAYGALHALQADWPLWTPAQGPAVDAVLAVAALGTGLAFALYLCTAMIYACLPFLAEWHTPLTLLNYTLLGGASGFTLATALATVAAPGRTAFLAGWAIVLTVGAALSRGASLWRNARLKPRSTPQSAIGIKHPVVVQRSMGFSGESFNTREFFHRASAAAMRRLPAAFFTLAFVLPAALLAAGRDGAAAVLPAAAFVVQFAGLLVERWFFFAQARHPQNLYYRMVC